MPGIYVRETSWLDWMQQRENPVLTVPGSYWLCHKHNIYKFIFRYHRTTRNIKHFDYGRELMKIIRRIIKNLPRQGQQFSTNNLLVTYNQTSWTRQDKIFAITKFKERSASAFSHAFVLTIKIISFLESSEQAVKCTVRTCSDQPLDWNNKELVHSFSNELPEHSSQFSQEKAYEKNNDKQLDDDFTLNKMPKNFTNKEFIKQKTHSKGFNKLLPSATVNEMSKNVSINDQQKLNKHSKATNEKSKKENNCTVSDKYLISSTVKETRLTCNQLEDADILKVETIDNKDYGNKVVKDIIQNDTSKFGNNEIDSTNGDSANLPYQYLIEREIENTKLNTINPKVSLLNSKKRKRQDVNEQCSAASADLFTNVLETEESDSSVKRKRESDNITPRSSDITDLVMEGLMFTIRQGQGTVTVIEQKTKLELDEVLENSEKIETTKGEKCLRNSSLLGLENLITMIESPKKTHAEQKPQNIIMQENFKDYRNTRKCMFNDVNHSFKDIYFSNVCLNKTPEMYKKSINVTEKEDLLYEKENEKEKEEEEEDIIPEALQDSLFVPPVLCSKKVEESENAAVNKDLLMDDINTEISTKFGITVEQDSYFGKEHKLQCEDLDNNTKKMNVPIIISNEIITTNEIPLPLQKLLQNKLSANLTSVNSINETEKINIINETLQMPECKNHNCNMHAESRSSNCNILESSPCSANHQSFITNNNETRNEDASFLILGDEYKNSNDGRNRLKESEDDLRKQPVSVDKEGHLLSCKLQDITQEFYQDILYLQRKKNLTNQHLNLRSRKRSVNMLQDSNTRDAHIEMIKFFHDITKGAKVVITRMSTKSIHSIIAKNS